jgi:urease accessory protein
VADIDAPAASITKVEPAADESAPGTGAIHVVRRGSRSLVRRTFARSPLRLLHPSNHGHGAWLFSSTYGGGLVGGDRVRLDIRIGRGATALLQTQSSTKVYRSSRGVSSDTHAVVEAGGLLAVLPDPVVCFAGSTYVQTQTVDLDGDAALLVVDWMTCGRRASGERWAFDCYSSGITVRCAGQLRLFDSVRLASGDGALPQRMGRFACLCTIVLLGSRFRAAAQRIHAVIGELPISGRTGMLLSVAPVDTDGCLVRLAGVSVEEVGRAVRTYLAFLPALLGDDPWARKW